MACCFKQPIFEKNRQINLHCIPFDGNNSDTFQIINKNTPI